MGSGEQTATAGAMLPSSEPANRRFEVRFTDLVVNDSLCLTTERHFRQLEYKLTVLVEENFLLIRLKSCSPVARLEGNPMEDVWTAEQLALQVMVWQMVRDGAVRGAQLAREFERNARFAPREEGYPLVILACLARAASRPELAEDCSPTGTG